MHRIIIGHIYQHLMRFMFQLKIRDVDCDFRLFRRSLFLRTPLTFESGVICVEMMKKFERRGYRIVEVPVHHYPRSHGSSQFFTIRHLRNIFGQLFIAWYACRGPGIFAPFATAKLEEINVLGPVQRSNDSGLQPDNKTVLITGTGFIGAISQCAWLIRPGGGSHRRFTAPCVQQGKNLGDFPARQGPIRPPGNIKFGDPARS
jgi:hypothetical protein